MGLPESPQEILVSTVDHHHCSYGGVDCIHAGVCGCTIYLFNILRVIKSKAFRLVAINILILGVISSPVTLPLGLAIFSISRATEQVRRGGELSNIDEFANYAIRRIGRHAYLSVPFRNIIQYDSNCFDADEKYLYLPKPLSECNQSNIEFSNRVRFGKYRDRLYSHAQNGTLLPQEKVLVVGDSHAMGWGVSDSEIFTNHLGTKGIRTINLSVSSYGTAKELARIKDFNKNYPDKYSNISTVVIQYCSNDYEENKEFLSNGRKNILFPAKQQIADFQNALKQFNVAHVPNNESLLRLLANTAMTRGTILSFYELVSLSIRNLSAVDSIISILKPKESELLSTQPTQSEAFYGVLGKYREILKNKKIIVFVSNDWGSSNNSLSKEFASNASLYNAQASSYSEEVSVVMPFKNSQEGLGYYYLDDHMNPLGHRILARSIADELTKRHWQK